MMAAETLLLSISLRCSSLLMIIVLLYQYFFQISSAKSNFCAPSCGIIRDISYPFRLKDDPKHCGDRRAELACENNVTFVYFNSHKYYVKAIHVTSQTIRVVDASINNDDTCSFPNSSASYYYPSNKYYIPFYSDDYYRNVPINLMSCPNPLKNSSSLVFTDITHDCASNNSSSLSRFAYIKVGSMKASELPQTCEIDRIVMTSWNKFMDWNSNNFSLSEIHQSLLYGFQLSFWYGSSVPAWVKLRDFFIPGETIILWILVGSTVGLLCAWVSFPVMTSIGFTAVSGLLLFPAIRNRIHGNFCKNPYIPLFQVRKIIYMFIFAYHVFGVLADLPTVSVPLLVIGALLIYVAFTISSCHL